MDTEIERMRKSCIRKNSNMKRRRGRRGRGHEDREEQNIFLLQSHYVFSTK